MMVDSELPGPRFWIYISKSHPEFGKMVKEIGLGDVLSNIYNLHNYLPIHHTVRYFPRLVWDAPPLQLVD